MASRRIEDLHLKFQPLARRFLSECQTAGHSLIITCGYRPMAEQDALYAQGRTKPGKIVTYARGGQSWHNYGLAIDVVFVKDGKAWWDGPWEAIGSIGEDLGMTWGGRFTRLPDRPHFEWHPGLTISKAKELVRQGYKPTEIPIPVNTTKEEE